jgi:endonuclease IV
MNNLSNHVITCNYCGKEQIVVHCGSNGNHTFEINEIIESAALLAENGYEGAGKDLPSTRAICFSIAKSIRELKLK